jgi:hypothetical protein
MKLFRLLGIALILCFFTNSCLEYQFTTRIFPDGSCERIMTVRGDSADLMHGIIKVPNDSSWKIKIAPVPGDQKKYELTATAHFPNVETLNKYFYKSVDSMPTVSIKSELVKKFRWFYSYLDYKETYMAFTPYRKVPISKFLTEDEVKILFAGDEKIIYQPNEDIVRLRRDTLEKVNLSHADSLKLEKKKEDIEKRYNEWLAQSMFEYMYDVLAERSEKIGSEKVNKEIMMASRDSIYAELIRNKPVNTEESHKGNSVTTPEMILEAARKYFPTEELSKVLSLDSLAFEEIDHKYDKMEAITSNTYGNKLLMPGIITSTNAKSLNGNILSWEIEPGEFFFYDYVMNAESRIMNKWAFWVSGILVLLLLGGLVAGILGKGRN